MTPLAAEASAAALPLRRPLPHGGRALAARYRAWLWSRARGFFACAMPTAAADLPLTAADFFCRNAGMFVLAIYLFRAKTEWFKVPPLPPMPAQ